MSLLATLSGHSDRVWHAAWHPSQLQLVTCGGDKAVRVWTSNETTSTSTSKEATWTQSASIDDAHKRTVRAVAFSPDATLLTSAGFDGATAIWESVGGSEFECVATLEGHENEVKSIAWSASGSLLATCSRDKSVWIWESLGDGDFECIAVLHEHSQDVKMVAWNPRREILASASYDDTIKIWRDKDDDWYCSDTLKGHTSTVWGIDFDETGDYIASVGDDKSLKIWHNANISDAFTPYKCISSTPSIHTRAVYSVSWSKTHGKIATCSGDNYIRVFEVDANKTAVKMIAEIPNAHGDFDVNSVRWCPLAEHGHLLASAGDDGNVKVWSFKGIVDSNSK
ncbi:WD40 repeat-like protein, partial [Rhizoclosmatium globosum]